MHSAIEYREYVIELERDVSVLCFGSEEYDKMKSLGFRISKIDYNNTTLLDSITRSAYAERNMHVFLNSGYATVDTIAILFTQECCYKKTKDVCKITAMWTVLYTQYQYDDNYSSSLLHTLAKHESFLRFILCQNNLQDDESCSHNMVKWFIDNYPLGAAEKNAIMNAPYHLWGAMKFGYHVHRPISKIIISSYKIAGDQNNMFVNHLENIWKTHHINTIQAYVKAMIDYDVAIPECVKANLNSISQSLNH